MEKKQLYIPEWLALSPEVRASLVSKFNLHRDTSTEVCANQVVCDGFSNDMLKNISLETMKEQGIEGKDFLEAFANLLISLAPKPVEEAITLMPEGQIIINQKSYEETKSIQLPVESDGQGQKKAMKKQSQYNSQLKAMDKDRKKKEARINEKVNDFIFPMLKKNTENVEDAKITCSALKVAIQQAVMNKMMALDLLELNLGEQLKGMEKKEWVKYDLLIKELETEKIADAYQILDGLVDEISAKERLFMKKYNLKHLYADNQKKTK